MNQKSCIKELEVLIFCGVTLPLPFFYSIALCSYQVYQTFLFSVQSHLTDTKAFGFLCTSGFVIPYSISQHPDKFFSVKNFLLRRLIRIHPSYLAALGLSVLILGVFLGNDDYLNPSAILVNSFYAAPFTNHNWLLSISWTLGVEAQFYIFIAIFYPYLTSEKPATRYASLAFICLFLLERITRISLVPFKTWSPFFAIGFIVFLSRTVKFPRKNLFLSH